MRPVRKAGPKKTKLRLGDPPLYLDFMREIMIVINAWKCYKSAARFTSGQTDQLQI